MRIISQKLFGILRQTVSSISKRRIIVKSSDTRIQTHAVNDLPGIQSLHLRIRIQLIKIRHPQSQICVGKQLHSLRLSKAHKKRIYVLLYGSLLQKTCKTMGRLNQPFILHICTHNDPGRVQVVIKGLGLPKELRAEQNILCMKPLSYRLGISNRNRGFNHHNGFRIYLLHQADHCLHCRGVKMVSGGIIICRGGNHHKIRLFVCILPVCGSCQIQFLFCQIFFNIIILDGRLFPVDQLHLFRNNIHGINLVVLSQQSSHRQSHIPGSCHCYSQFVC